MPTCPPLASPPTTCSSRSAWVCRSGCCSWWRGSWWRASSPSEGAGLPELPWALDRRPVRLRRAPALLVAEELYRALEAFGLQLQLRVHPGVDRAEHHLGQVLAHDRHAVAAHQHAAARAERVGEGLAERPV